MKKLTLFLLVFITFCSCNDEKIVSNHSMHPLSQIKMVKDEIKNGNEPFLSAYKQLTHYADSILELHENALIDFSVPGYYIDPQAHRANSLALQKDAFSAYCLALAFRLSGNKKYGEKACYFLRAWAEKNEKYSEHDGVLVMAYSGTALMMGAELMSDTKIWKAEDKDRFTAWVKRVYQPATNEIRARKNNWADWGRLGSLLAASYLDEPEEVVENVRLIKSDLFHKIADDGSMPEETRREKNGIWYTYFSLAPLTASCWLVYNLTGENLFFLEENGKSIKKALDYLYYYNLHPNEWKWFENPNQGSPSMWPGNLLEAMAGIYNDSRYADYVKESRPLIYPIHHFAWSFPTLMPLSVVK